MAMVEDKRAKDKKELRKLLDEIKEAGKVAELALKVAEQSEDRAQRILKRHS